MTTLIRILQKKGIFTFDELKAEKAEAIAAVAVDLATDPDLLDMEKRLKQEMEKEEEDLDG